MVRSSVLILSVFLYPVFLTEQIKHESTGRNHDAYNYIIRIFPVKLRHIVKVHAVNARNQRQWNEDRCNGGKHAHDFIGPISDTGLVSLSKVPHEIPVGLEGFGNFHGIFIDIAEIFLRLVIDQPEIFCSAY